MLHIGAWSTKQLTHMGMNTKRPSWGMILFYFMKWAMSGGEII